MLWVKTWRAKGVEKEGLKARGMPKPTKKVGYLLTVPRPGSSLSKDTRGFSTQQKLNGGCEEKWLERRVCVTSSLSGRFI